MRVFLYAAALLLTACIEPIPPSERAQAVVSPKSVITAHVDAFNRGDVEGMAKMQHPNIEWLSVSGNAVSVEVSGRDALSKNMADYFKSPTKVTGTLRDWNINAPYVSVTETASWTAADGTAKSQSSMTVYELENNLIRRVWYYPAVDE
jgi:hypothetical protein